jgi:hypothetical protein
MRLLCCKALRSIRWQQTYPGELAKLSKKAIWPEVKPRAGIMVGLPVFKKARSIKHCCQLVGHRKASVERKYDGEYCQIHIQRRRAGDDINIFSKSGRNSTQDELGFMKVLKRASVWELSEASSSDSVSWLASCWCGMARVADHAFSQNSTTRDTRRTATRMRSGFASLGGRAFDGVQTLAAGWAPREIMGLICRNTRTHVLGKYGFQ